MAKDPGLPVTSPASAHLFIVAPLIGSLFSTHPPIKDRIQRLIGRDNV